MLLWRPFHRCFVKLQRGWDKTSDIVDVFASLSHGTLMYQFIIFFRCQALNYIKDGNSGLKHVSLFVPYVECKHHSIPLAIFFSVILFIFNIIPVLLLVLYPFKLFRQCLSKCKLERLFITIFVEKFHGCYRDGLDGGRDMRSFSGIYYVMMVLISQYSKIKRLKVSRWLYHAFIFLCFALLIIILRPYKQKYVNILETLFLVYIAITCVLLSRDPFAGEETQILIVLLIPSIVFGLIIFLKACIKLKNSLIKECKYSCKQYFIGSKVDSEENANETQTLINPTSDYITYGK